MNCWTGIELGVSPTGPDDRRKPPQKQAKRRSVQIRVNQRLKIASSYFDIAPSAARKIASKFSRPADATARSTAFSASARW